MRCLMFSAVIALTTVSELNWRAQLRTQQKLDEMARAFAAQVARLAPPTTPAVPVPPSNPPPPAAAQAPGPIGGELSALRSPPSGNDKPDVIAATPGLATLPLVVDFGSGPLVNHSDEKKQLFTFSTGVFGGGGR